MKKKKILIVDDMEKVHKRLSPLSRTYEIDNAYSKEEALRMIKEKHYDKVITDYHLGDDDLEGGLEVIKAAKNKRLEVISMSTVNHEQKALEEGADKFLLKRELFQDMTLID